MYYYNYGGQGGVMAIYDYFDVTISSSSFYYN